MLDDAFSPWFLVAAFFTMPAVVVVGIFRKFDASFLEIRDLEATKQFD